MVNRQLAVSQAEFISAEFVLYKIRGLVDIGAHKDQDLKEILAKVRCILEDH